MYHTPIPSRKRNNIFYQSEVPAATETILHSVSASDTSTNPVSTQQSVLPSARGSSQATAQQDSTLATTEASGYQNNPIHMGSSINSSTEQSRDLFYYACIGESDKADKQFAVESCVCIKSTSLK